MAVVPADSFLAALRTGLFKKADRPVAMGLLSVTVPNFPHDVLEIVVRAKLRRAADDRSLPEWDRQPGERLQWQDKESRAGRKRSYILHTWAAVEALCGFHSLKVPRGQHAKDNFRSVGRSGDLIVVLPPITITHRYAPIFPFFLS